MAKQSEFERHALIKAQEAENRAKKFDESAMKCRAEAKAYLESIEWYKNTQKDKKEKSKKK